jgi:hypothetical protein
VDFTLQILLYRTGVLALEAAELRHDVFSGKKKLLVATLLGAPAGPPPLAIPENRPLPRIC